MKFRNNTTIRFIKLKIPRYLYRGDSDKNTIRRLKETIGNSQLQTNLINGGNGNEIKNPLSNLIHKHVAFSWPLTHFLSFSENNMTAFRFGINCEINEVEERILDFEEYYFGDSLWDFAIITLDTQKIQWNKIGTGIYEGLYNPSLIKFGHIEKYRILCINVIEVLSANVQHSQSINNAKRDSEWLILPATLITLNSNKTEYSAILDMSDVFDVEKYKQRHVANL